MLQLTVGMPVAVSLMQRLLSFLEVPNVYVSTEKVIAFPDFALLVFPLIGTLDMFALLILKETFLLPTTAPFVVVVIRFALSLPVATTLPLLQCLRLL